VQARICGGLGWATTQVYPARFPDTDFPTRSGYEWTWEGEGEWDGEGEFAYSRHKGLLRVRMFNGGDATPNPHDYEFAYTPGKVGGYSTFDSDNTKLADFIAHTINIDYLRKRVMMMCHTAHASGSDETLRLQFSINDNNQISGQIDSFATGHIADFTNLNVKTGCNV